MPDEDGYYSTPPRDDDPTAEPDNPAGRKPEER